MHDETQDWELKVKHFLTKFDFIKWIKHGSILATLISFFSLFIYFSAIRFIPILNFQSIAYIFLFISASTFVLLSVSAGCLYMAPTIWGKLFEDHVLCKPANWKAKDFICLKDERLITEVHPKINFFMVLTYAISTSIYLSLLQLAFHFKYELAEQFFIAFPFIGLMLSTVISNGEKKKYPVQCICNEKDQSTLFEKILFLVKFVIYTSISSMLLMIPIGGFITLYDRTQINPEVGFGYLYFFAMVLFSGSAIIQPREMKNKRLWTLFVSILIIVYSLSTLGITGTVVSKVFAYYKLGSIKNAAITIDYEGCQIIKGYGVSIHCTKDILHTINVNLLWRIGEACIEIKDQRQNSKIIFFDASHIKSVSTEA